MPPAALSRLTLTDFRSYERVALVFDGPPVALYGPNGAGKTNLLEAISFLAPGRGIRGASAPDAGRRLPGETRGRAWSVAAVLDAPGGEVKVGTGLEPGASRRTVRLEGETVAPGRLAEMVRLVWLTPQQDRLFMEGGTERRRFLDRLVFAAEPAHAAAASAYEKTMRERLRLLTDGPNDPAWLDALEARASEAGAALAAGRARTVGAAAGRDRRPHRPALPASRPQSFGRMGRGARHRGSPAGDAAPRTRAGRRRRPRPVRPPAHRPDRHPPGEGSPRRGVLHRRTEGADPEPRPGPGGASDPPQDPSDEFSAESAPNPILLLDEVAAHLDAARRAALFDEIVALGLQAFLTGTDRMLFSDLGKRAQIAHVDRSALTMRDD